MRFMVIVHPVSAKAYEQGAMPKREELMEMGKFNEKLVDAGVMAMGEGLAPTMHGTRLTFSGGKVTKEQKGPFGTDEERIGGFWIWNCASQEEAVKWARQAPMGEGDILEIRRIMEAEDFGGEVEEQENTLKEKMKRRG